MESFASTAPTFAIGILLRSATTKATNEALDDIPDSAMEKVGQNYDTVNLVDTPEPTKPKPKAPPDPFGVMAKLQPIAAKMFTAYSVPEVKYSFRKYKLKALDPSQTQAFDEYKDFNQATESLIPLDPIRTNLNRLQSSLEAITLDIEKNKRSIQKAVDDPTYVHHCVRVKPQFTRPKDAKAYPDMLKMYNKIQDDLNTLGQVYHKLSTHLILQGQKGQLFQLRMDRIRTLSHDLIDGIACFHALHYRNLHKHEHTLSPDYEIPPKETIATLALHRLYSSSPEPLLVYLDINRPELLELFERLYPQSKPENQITLNALDRQAVQHTQALITQYLGTITWIPHNLRVAKTITEHADEATRIAMEKKASREASQATKQALDEDSLAYPKTPKTLADAVDSRLEAKLAAKQNQLNMDKATLQEDMATLQARQEELLRQLKSKRKSPPTGPPSDHHSKKAKTPPSSNNPKGAGGTRPPPEAKATGKPRHKAKSRRKPRRQPKQHPGHQPENSHRSTRGRGKVIHKD